MQNRALHTKQAKSSSRLIEYLDEAVSNAPLVSFRIVFGALMVCSTLRFWYLGWIEDHYINTQLTFKYFGFYWVELLSPTAMYALHILLLLSALGILFGLFYRWSTLLFFLSFTYIELVDLTYYLNHYYFVSITSMLLIWVPANRRVSLDVWRKPEWYQKECPRWCILIFKLQIAIVYIYAGLAKINYDWLIQALPLKIWLPAHDDLPLIGPLLRMDISAYVFSWVGMLYDCTIVFFLAWRKTRGLAYLSVVVFHGLTAALFQIGVFPWVMMGATWIYFGAAFHERVLAYLKELFYSPQMLVPTIVEESQRGAKVFEKGSFAQGIRFNTSKLLLIGLGIYFTFQLVFPWRYQLYPGNIFWTEEGYRFSWRVMLMEKAGTATFYVWDARTGREGVVDNSEFLRPHQEKQMAMQPDMIVQYAHFLADHYQSEGVQNPKVRAEVYVTLNARPSQLLLDPNLDLTTVQDSWRHKKWVLPYEY